MTSSDSILFLFEGKRTEKSYFENLSKHIRIKESLGSHIITAYSANIYQLYQEISDDHDIDLILLLKERGELSENIDSSCISQVYLFFDYEPHEPLASKNKIDAMLDLFCNETDAGMLFISYPMIEALKYATDKSKNIESFCKFHVPINESKNFKKLMGQWCINADADISSYKIGTWKTIILNHCCKANFLVSKDHSFPQMPIPQNNIHQAIIKYLDENNHHLPVLAAYPLWLLQYFGSETLLDLLNSNQI